MAACHMKEIFHQHVPVLLNETVQNLVTSPDGIYIDATFGRGSHSRAILQKLSAKGRLIAIDKDEEAVKFGKQLFANESRFQIFHASFARLTMLLDQLKLEGAVQGILFDLGVSSPQLDNPQRGFSFSKAGPLDMRMNTSQGIPANEWLMHVSEAELSKILWVYGEERFAKRIAKAIVAARLKQPITTTTALAEIIKQAIPKSKAPKDKHPATKTFQAIRIAINQELTELESALPQALQALVVGGRLAIISFHSLEDRIVKQFFKIQEKGEILPRGLPIKGDKFQAKLKTLVKPIKPSTQEIDANQRARSATLRIAEKIS